jgi:hypothetical protein
VVVRLLAVLLACLSSGVFHLGVSVVGDVPGPARPATSLAEANADDHDDHDDDDGDHDEGDPCGEGCGNGCDDGCSPVCQDCVCSLGARLLPPGVPRLVMGAMSSSSLFLTPVLTLPACDDVGGPPRAPALAGVFHPPRA